MKKKSISFLLTFSLACTVINPGLKIHAVEEWSNVLTENQIIQSSDMLYSPEIPNLCKIIETMVADPNGKTYNDAYYAIFSSNLNETDKGYLLGKLSSLGAEKVFTEDYIKATDALVNAWNCLGNDTVNDAIRNAESLIDNVSNKSSKEYLKEQLQGTKDRISAPLVIPSDIELTKLIYDANRAIDNIILTNAHDPNCFTKEGSFQILGSEFDSEEKMRSYLKNFFSDKVINDFERIVYAGYKEEKYCIFPYQGVSYNFKFIGFNKKEIKNNKLYITISASVFDDEPRNIAYTLEKINGKLIFSFFNSYTGSMGEFEEIIK